MPDVLIRNEGTIIQIIPETEAAKEWIDENVHSEPWQWLGPTLCVDHRMAGPLIEGMADAGLELAEA